LRRRAVEDDEGVAGVVGPDVPHAVGRVADDRRAGRAPPGQRRVALVALEVGAVAGDDLRVFGVEHAAHGAARVRVGRDEEAALARLGCARDLG
jgi:hypothetical protein